MSYRINNNEIKFSEKEKECLNRQGEGPSCILSYRTANEQLHRLRLRFKDCQQIVDENGNVINAFPPQTLFRRPVNGNVTYLPVDPTTGFTDQIPVMTFEDIGCNGTGPSTNCCGRVTLHPEGFFGGLPSSLFRPDLSDDVPPMPLYLTENYFSINFNQWLEITGYSIMWEYLGPSGVSTPKFVSSSWSTGCITDPGVYRLTVMDACGNLIRSTFNVNRSLPDMAFSPSFVPDNNQSQVAYYENTLMANITVNQNPRAYVVPFLDSTGNTLPGAFYNAQWNPLGCSVDFEADIQNACGAALMKVYTAGTTGPSTIIFSQVMQIPDNPNDDFHRYLFKNFDLLDFNLVVEVIDACGRVLSRTVSIDRSQRVYYRNPTFNVLGPESPDPALTGITYRPNDFSYPTTQVLKERQRISGMLYTAVTRQAPLTREIPTRFLDRLGVPGDLIANLNGASLSPGEINYYKLYPTFVPTPTIPVTSPGNRYRYSMSAPNSGAWVVIDPTITATDTTGLDVDRQLAGPLIGVYEIEAEYQCAPFRRSPLPGIPTYRSIFARDFLEKFSFHGSRFEQSFVEAPVPPVPPFTENFNWGIMVWNQPKPVTDQTFLIHNNRPLAFASSHTLSFFNTQFHFHLEEFSLDNEIHRVPLMHTWLHYKDYNFIHTVAYYWNTHIDVPTFNQSGFTPSRVTLSIRETFRTAMIHTRARQNLINRLTTAIGQATIDVPLMNYVFQNPIYGPPINTNGNCATYPLNATIARQRFLGSFGINNPAGTFFQNVQSIIFSSLSTTPLSTRIDIFRRGLLALFLERVVGTTPSDINLTTQERTNLINRLFNMNISLSQLILDVVDAITKNQTEETIERELELLSLQVSDNTFSKSNTQVTVGKQRVGNIDYYYVFLDGVYRQTVQSQPQTYTIAARNVYYDFNNLSTSAINVASVQTASTNCPNETIFAVDGAGTMFNTVTLQFYTVPTSTVQLRYGTLPPASYQAPWLRNVLDTNSFLNTVPQSLFTTISRLWHKNLYSDYSYYGAYDNAGDVVTVGVNGLSTINNEPAITNRFLTANPLEEFSVTNNPSMPSDFLRATVWNIWNLGHGTIPKNVIGFNAGPLQGTENDPASRRIPFYQAAVGRYMMGFFNGVVSPQNTTDVLLSTQFIISGISLGVSRFSINGTNASTIQILPTGGLSSMMLPTTWVNAPYTLPIISRMWEVLRNRRKEIYWDQATAGNRRYSQAPSVADRYSLHYNLLGNYEPVTVGPGA